MAFLFNERIIFSISDNSAYAHVRIVIRASPLFLAHTTAPAIYITEYVPPCVRVYNIYYRYMKSHHVCAREEKRKCGYYIIRVHVKIMKKKKKKNELERYIES